MVLTLVFASGLSASVAWAEPTKEERALAEALFQDAKALIAKEQYSEACPKLAESQQLDSGGGTQLLLGLCLEEWGKTASAWVELREALSLAKRDGNAAREKIARRHLESLEPLLSKVLFSFARGARLPDLVLEHQGTSIPAAAWSTALPLDPGEHEIVVRAPGHAERRISFVLAAEGAKQTVSIPRLDPLDSAPSGEPEEPFPGTGTPPAPDDRQLAVSPASTSSRDSSKKTWGYVVGGTGVVLSAVGAALGIRAADLAARINASCPDVQCDPALEDDYRRARTSATLSTALLGVGGLGVGVGAILLLTGGSKSTSEASRRLRVARALELRMGPSRGSIHLQGVF